MSSPDEIRFKEQARASVKKSAKQNLGKTKEKSRAAFKTKISAERAEKVSERRSTRTKRRPIEDIIKGKIRFAGPRYTAADNRLAGGKHSSATLGPGCTSGLGSDSKADKPGAMARARAAYGIAFISGHLLNADFGGDGADSANLTILTGAANSSHKAFDSPVLKAVGALANVYKDLYALGMDVEDLSYGIKVTIDTLPGTWSDKFPGSCISNGLSCTAEVVNRPDEDAIIAKLPAEADRILGWENKLEATETAMDGVDELIAQANDNGEVDNAE
jgi:hypothetical protein